MQIRETHDYPATAGLVCQRNPSITKEILPHCWMWLALEPHVWVENILTVLLLLERAAVISDRSM